MHVSELGEDYFQFDSIKHEMLGERTGKRYRLGDRLDVRLVRADLESGRIDFVLAEPPLEVRAQIAASVLAGEKPKVVSRKPAGKRPS